MRFDRSSLIRMLTLTLGLLAVWMLPAEASPSSCSIMPTADILESGSVSLEFENDAFRKIGGSESTYYSLLQIGVTPRLELGFDSEETVEETNEYFNAKYLAVEESKSSPAVAIGTMGITKGGKTTWYSVATRSFGDFRTHLGYIDSGYAHGAMLGCDYTLPKGTCITADWMEGGENYIAFGVTQELKEGYTLNLTYGMPNANNADNLFVVNLAYSFSFSGK